MEVERSRYWLGRPRFGHRRIAALLRSDGWRAIDRQFAKFVEWGGLLD